MQAVIISASIIIGSIIVGRYITRANDNNNIGTYQVIKADENNVIILNTRTGQYWRKPIVDDSSIKREEDKSNRYA